MLIASWLHWVLVLREDFLSLQLVEAALRCGVWASHRGRWAC